MTPLLLSCSRAIIFSHAHAEKHKRTRERYDEALDEVRRLRQEIERLRSQPPRVVTKEVEVYREVRVCLRHYVHRSKSTVSLYTELVLLSSFCYFISYITERITGK